METSANSINARIGAIAPSVTLGITARAKEMTASGREVWSFAAGEPDFDTPDHIKEAAMSALLRGETKYAPVRGLTELRSAIVSKLLAENGLSYTPDCVVVSNGGKHSLFNVIMAICNDGDEVIIPGPYWLSYPEMVRVAGGRSVIIPTDERGGFKMSPEQLTRAITDKTRAVIINSPSNPTGAVYSTDELSAIADIVVRKDLLVISDEIYEKIVYDGAEHTSIGSLSKDVFDRTITLNGLSKAYSMTGWRLGYCAGPKSIVDAVAALQSHSTSGVNTFAQHGGLAAMLGPSDAVDHMVAAFTERRELLFGRLTSISGVTCAKPMGAFYMFPNVSACGLDSRTFAERLLNEHNVAVVPGAAFGADTHVRLSYACSTETIEKGMDGFEEFVGGL